MNDVVIAGDPPHVVEQLLSLREQAGPFGSLVLTAHDWDEEELPHLAIGIFQIIFGYFANVSLFAGVFLDDPQSPKAIERQRHFLKKAYTKLLGNGGNRLH